METGEIYKSSPPPRTGKAFPSNEQTESIQRKRVNGEKHGEYEGGTGGKRKRRKMGERERERRVGRNATARPEKNLHCFRLIVRRGEPRRRRRRRRMILTGREEEEFWWFCATEATGSRYRARVLANSTLSRVPRRESRDESRE